MQSTKPLADQLITFDQAAEMLPPDQKPSASTWWRWCRFGIGGVRLESYKVGSRRYTSRGAVERFISRLSGATQPIRKCNRDEAHDRVERFLDAERI